MSIITQRVLYYAIDSDILISLYNIKQITYYSYVVDKKKSTRSRHTI